MSFSHVSMTGLPRARFHHRMEFNLNLIEIIFPPERPCSDDGILELCSIFAGLKTKNANADDRLNILIPWKAILGNLPTHKI